MVPNIRKKQKMWFLRWLWFGSTNCTTIIFDLGQDRVWIWLLLLFFMLLLLLVDCFFFWFLLFWLFFLGYCSCSFFGSSFFGYYYYCWLEQIETFGRSMISNVLASSLNTLYYFLIKMEKWSQRSGNYWGHSSDWNKVRSLSFQSLYSIYAGFLGSGPNKVQKLVH